MSQSRTKIRAENTEQISEEKMRELLDHWEVPCSDLNCAVNNDPEDIPYVVLDHETYPGCEAHFFTIADMALWRNGMIGTLEKADRTGKKKIIYFVSDYGKQIFNLVVDRYKLAAVEGVEIFLENDKGKVLVVCPFYGGKTEQGVTKCRKCGADM